MERICSINFELVTDNVVVGWKKEKGVSSWTNPEGLVAGRFILEVVWRVVLGDLPAKLVPSVLQSAGLIAGGENAHLLGDSISVVDAEINQLATTKAGGVIKAEEASAAASAAHAGKQRLKDLANELILAEVLTLRQLAEVVEADFLVEGGYTPTKGVQFKNKTVRINTKMLYTQTRFNLQAEESEGYAKVVTLLGQEGAITESSLEAAKRNIQALIGFFDLDPYRVLDLTMDSLEMNPEYTMLLKITSSFNASARAQVLGFKFQYYQREGVTQATPQSLCRLAGRLIKEDLVEIDALWPHLSPADEEGVEEYQAWLKERAAEANRYGVVNLAQTEATGLENEQGGLASQQVDISRPAGFEEEGVRFWQDKLSKHQKLGLLEGLLHANDWIHAQMVLERLSGLGPLSWPPVAKALCRAINVEIAPIYSCTQPPYLSGKTAAVALHDGAPSSFHLSAEVVVPAKIVNMLFTLGPYAYRDAIVLTKVCRSLWAHILTAAYKFPLDNFHISSVYGVVKDGVIEDCTPALQSAIRTAASLLEKVLLPALMMTPANPAILYEVWELMKLLPYELRYELYGTWDSVGAGSSQEELEKWPPMLVFARKFANIETRKILRRVADIKEKAFERHERLLIKLTHSNPLVTLSSVVKQMENYTAMIPAAIAIFQGLNYLEHEVVEYLILQALSQKRPRLKDSGLDIADWLQHLAEFVGSWGKKHHGIINLHGIIQMMVKQAINAQPWDLVILQEMLGQMANVRVVEDTQDDLQEAMAGGEKLYFEAFNIGSMKLTRQENRTVNKALVKLKETLYPSPDDAPRLAMPLLLGIAQLRNRILFEADPFSLPTPNVKVTGGQYDMLHKIFIQLYEYLVKAVPDSEFATLVPPLDQLVNSYYLEPEVAMLIFRPVLQDLKLKTAPKLVHQKQLQSAKAEGDVKNEETLALTTEPESDTELAVELGNVKLTWKTLLATIQSFHAPPIWGRMSPLLYLRFWSLSLSDIYVPRARYLSEIEKVQKAAKEAQTMVGWEQKKRDREAKVLRDTVKTLEAELAAQEKNVEAVKQILKPEKDQWAPTNHSIKLTKAPEDFLQTCILPRVALSLPDALFSFHFVMLIHEIEVPGITVLSLVHLLVVKMLGPLIALSSEFEAARFGKFLAKLLRILQNWKKDEETFKREELNNLREIGTDNKMTWLEYSEHLFKWHNWISRHVGRHLESKDPMRIRNSLIVLKEVKDSYPVIKKHAIFYQRKLDALINDKETTEDILLIARSYKGILILKETQGHLVEPHVFNPNMPPPQPGALKPKRAATPGSTRSRQASVAPKASPLRPSESPANKPPEAVTNRIAPKVGSTTDLTAVAKAETAVNGVLKETESKSESPEIVAKKDEKQTGMSRLNPNAKPFAPKEESKPKAADKRDEKSAPEKTPSKIEDNEQEEGEISETPDRPHEKDLDEEHRPKNTESPVRKEASEKLPLGKLLEAASNQRKVAVAEREKMGPTAPETSARRESNASPLRDGKGRPNDVSIGREIDVSRGRENDVGRGREKESDVTRGRESDVIKGRESDVTRGRENDVGRGREKEGDVIRGRASDVIRGRESEVTRGRDGGGKESDVTRGRESDVVRGRESERRSVHRSDSKDGLRESEKDEGRVKDSVRADRDGLRTDRNDNDARRSDKDGGRNEKDALRSRDNTPTLPPRSRPGREQPAEQRSRERAAENAKETDGQVRDSVKAGETRKESEGRASRKSSPYAERKQLDAAGKSERNGAREIHERVVTERRGEVLERKGSGVPTDRRASDERRSLDDRKGGLKGSRIISLGRPKEAEAPENVSKRLSMSPGSLDDLHRREKRSDRDAQPERERKRHKAEATEQRQVVRSLAVDPGRRFVPDEDLSRRIVLPEAPRRDRIVVEDRAYENRPRFSSEEAGPTREVIAARAPSRERARGGLDGGKERPPETRRRSNEDAPERGGASSRLDRVTDDQASKLREQLMKRQIERERAEKASADPSASEVSPRKRTKAAEPRTVLSVAAMELGPEIQEGPSRPPRSERHHKHESKHEKGEERVRSRHREEYDGEHERRRHKEKSHKKRKHE